jgi:hypothetical protein
MLDRFWRTKEKVIFQGLTLNLPRTIAMAGFVHLKRQAVEHIDRYFSGVTSAEELCAWALAHPVFANPKALDNNEDWMISNALALMVALADAATDQSVIEQGLREAWQFLTGGKPFPDDRWPAGLLK